ESWGHIGNVWKLAFSPSGDGLASIGKDDRVILWDLPKARPRFSITPYGYFRQLAFTRDGEHLLAPLDQKTAMLGKWETATGKLAGSFENRIVEEVQT